MRNGRSFTNGGWSNPNDYPGMSNLEKLRGRELYLQDVYWKVFKIIWLPCVILGTALIYRYVRDYGFDPVGVYNTFRPR